MAKKTFSGDLTIKDSDFHEVIWTGRTKGGVAVKITLHNAINRDDIDLTAAEKADTVASATFEACYENTDTMDVPAAEPWEIECADSSIAGARSILLGAGKVSIDGKDVALTRGGSQFTRAVTIREQNADGDFGAVKGRVSIDEARAKLKCSLLTFLPHFGEMYPGVTVKDG